MDDRKKVKCFAPTTQGSQIEVRTDLTIKETFSKLLSSLELVLAFRVSARQIHVKIIVVKIVLNIPITIASASDHTDD